MTAYIYKCYKCNRGPRVEQRDDEPELNLNCRSCGRKLFRCNIAPGICTDSTFMAGSHVDDGFGSNEWGRKRARAKAKAAGVDVTGARYCPQLCPTGESLSPKAWVRGKADVVRRCQELGVGCEGAVNVSAPPSETPDAGPYQVNDTIVNRRVEKKLADAGAATEALGRNEYQDLWHKEKTLASGNQ